MEVGCMTSSSDSLSAVFLAFFLLVLPKMFILPFSMTKELTSGMERVPLLSALKEALGLATVCLNHPTSCPHTYYWSYSLLPL